MQFSNLSPFDILFPFSRRPILPESTYSLGLHATLTSSITAMTDRLRAKQKLMGGSAYDYSSGAFARPP